MTIRQKLYDLYAQGYGYKSPEAKKVAPNYGTRYHYSEDWDKAGRPGYVGHEAKATVQSKTDSTLVVEHEPSDTITKKAGTTADEADRTKDESDKRKGLGFASPVPPRMLKIGQFLIPEANWGFSDEYNMLLVAATYSRVSKPKSEGGMDYGGYVGDFCADCVRIFRRLFGFEYLREEEPTEVEHAETGRRLDLELGGATEPGQEPED